MKRIFAIHGWYSSPYAAWIPWLKHQLEEKGFFVHAPEMPNPVNPKCDEWISKIRSEIKNPDIKTFLVGHSLGCVAILRYLESIDSKVGGVILVASPSDNMQISFIRSFFEKEFDWKKIKDNCGKIVIIHSDNDNIVPIKHAYFLAEQLDGELIIEHQGHFTGTENVKELQVVLDKIISLSAD